MTTWLTVRILAAQPNRLKLRMPPADLQKQDDNPSPAKSRSYSSAPWKTTWERDLGAFARAKAAEFEQFHQEMKGKAPASEPFHEEIPPERRKRRQDGRSPQPIHIDGDEEAVARRKSYRIKDQGHLHSITYQDPLIQQELHNVIRVDDDDFVNIAL